MLMWDDLRLRHWITLISVADDKIKIIIGFQPKWNEWKMYVRHSSSQLKPPWQQVPHDFDNIFYGRCELSTPDINQSIAWSDVHRMLIFAKGKSSLRNLLKITELRVQSKVCFQCIPSHALITASHLYGLATIIDCSYRKQLELIER